MHFQSEQELFDHVAEHLLAQNAPSRRGPTCLYHGPNGLKCAVGACIEDEEYSPSMEGHSVRELVTEWPTLSHLQPFKDLLTHLQYAHDCVPVKEWPEELRVTAANHNLTSNF